MNTVRIGGVDGWKDPVRVLVRCVQWSPSKVVTLGTRCSVYRTLHQVPKVFTIEGFHYIQHIHTFTEH